MGLDRGFEAVTAALPYREKNCKPDALLLRPDDADYRRTARCADPRRNQPRSRAGAFRTHDLGGTASTSEFTDAVCREIEK